jgi:hypothetical protein
LQFFCVSYEFAIAVFIDKQDEKGKAKDSPQFGVGSPFV